MLLLKENEICPKKDVCMFAEVGGEKCYGTCFRNSLFTCDLDFSDEPSDISFEQLQVCSLQI